MPYHPNTTDVFHLRNLDRKADFMRIGILGCGFIGTTIGGAMEHREEVGEINLIDRDFERTQDLAQRLSKAQIFGFEDMEGFIKRSDLVVEAASQDVVEEIGPMILGAGKDLLIISVGALVDDRLWNELKTLAGENNARIYIPSGAIAGIDGIISASRADIEYVRLTVRKPPKGLSLPPSMQSSCEELFHIKEPITLFDGSARDAVKIFPKNVNVAATLAIAGIGFDRTEVRVIADPSVTLNRHLIEVRGRFGEMRVEMENQPSTTNPRTSYLAPLSAISTIERIISGVNIGN